MPDPNTIKMIALRTQNLDTACYRGSASLADLARISQADVFDQVTKPDGLQRDFSKKHAVDAYQYVAREPDPKLPRAFPEVILNVRDAKVVKVVKVAQHGLAKDGQHALVELTFDLDKILAARTVKVSRVDGNHRLLLAGGNVEPGLPTVAPLDVPAPFQLHIGLDRDQETELFSDVNANQKGLNTSHLAVLRSRLTPDEVEKETHPARAIARQLAADVASPWHDLVHMGGSRAGSKAEHRYLPITFTALESGVRRMLSKSGYLREREFDAKYGLVRTYWQAVKAVYPEAFEAPRDYLVAKNIGVQAFSLLGALVIDRCLIAGKVEVGHMVPFLLAAKPHVDWHKDSKAVAGMSGNRAALLLSNAMSDEVPEVASEYVEPEAAEAEARQLTAA